VTDDSAAGLRALPFLVGLPRAVARLAEAGTERCLGVSDLLLQEGAPVHEVSFLLEGRAEVLLRFDGLGAVTTDVLERWGSLAGWSAFRPPYRATAAVRCTTPCRFLVVPRAAFAPLFAADPALEPEVLRRLTGAVVDRLSALRPAVPLVIDRRPARVQEPERAVSPTAGTGRSSDPTAIRRWLRGLTLYTGMPDTFLEFLASVGRLTENQAGDVLVEQGAPLGDLAILVDGAARLTFDDAGTITQVVRTPGYPVGWTAATSPWRAQYSAVADPARLLLVDEPALERHLAASPAAAVALTRRLLWLVGDTLRAARIRGVTRRWATETAAVRELLAASRASLSPTSPLHKLAHSLEHAPAVGHTLRALDVVRFEGDELERRLAGRCAELLAEVRRAALSDRSPQGSHGR